MRGSWVSIFSFLGLRGLDRRKWRILKRKECLTMALQQWLMPGENIQYRGGEVWIQGQKCELFITSERLLFYANQGFFFKKEFIVAERLADIESMSYSETGNFSKQGKLEVHFRYKKILPIKGTPQSVRLAWQTLQHYIRRPNAPQQARVAFDPSPLTYGYETPTIESSSTRYLPLLAVGTSIVVLLGVVIVVFMLIETSNSNNNVQSANYNVARQNANVTSRSTNTSQSVRSYETNPSQSPAQQNYNAPPPIANANVYSPPQENFNTSSPIAQIPNSPKEALCNHQEANVRAQPNVVSPSVYILKYGERVTVYNHIDDWAYVETMDGTRGYVRSNLLSAFELDQ